MRVAVLKATITELTKTGYAALTVEGVAQRAGVHKTTIYRNWRDS
ncbi:TetR/AcrR family transcriptional regulator, partial [Streptomyces sp. NPDC058439]